MCISIDEWKTATASVSYSLPYIFTQKQENALGQNAYIDFLQVCALRYAQSTVEASANYDLESTSHTHGRPSKVNRAKTSNLLYRYGEWIFSDGEYITSGSLGRVFSVEMFAGCEKIAG